MDTSSPSRLLTDEHRRIDVGVKAVADGGGTLAALAESLELLRLHIYVEEELLFPPLAKAGLTMPVFVMKREHGEMWPLLGTLASACESGAPVATLQEPALHLFRQLQVHNGKEEDIVYAAADRLVESGTDAALVETLQAGKVPDGWTCAMAPR